jgi:hypothetical protein
MILESPPKVHRSRFRRRLWRAVQITWQTALFFLSAPHDSKNATRRFRGFSPSATVTNVRRTLRRFLFNSAALLRTLLRAITRKAPFTRRRHPGSSTQPRLDPVSAQARSTRRRNRAKLGALSLRREDSSLLAFSAFAAITTFAPQRRESSGISQLHINFLLGYFSPIGFGFGLSMLIFCMYPIAAALTTTAPTHGSVSKFPIMASICVWFFQSLLYLNYTLRQDFAPLFRNYFDARMFPNSMTRYANYQISRVPNLTQSIQNELLTFFIAILMFGLAGLYAAFLHNLP